MHCSLFTMLYSYVLPVLLGLITMIFLRYFVSRLRVSSISNLPGPPPGSWLLGNLPEIVRPENVGDAEFYWTKKFGASVHIKSSFNRNVLFTADPKALQYILNTSRYNFPKPPEWRLLISMVTGKGIIWADGKQHMRHRKVMEPAFSHSSIKSFLPMFREKAQHTTEKWRDIVAQQASTSSVIDIHSWLARLSLDAMGGALDYNFGALADEPNSELTKVYKNLFADTYFNRSDYALAFQDLCSFLPEWMVSVLQTVPNKQVERLNSYFKVALRVAQSLVDRQLKFHAMGKEGGKDFMSLLVNANLSEDPKNKLENKELLAQLTTLLLAGHETVASSVTWALYELSRYPEFQNRVRAEIRALRSQRGNGELDAKDFESLHHVLALIKETLRYHPILPNMSRAAGRDDVIPLSEPQRTNTGETITCIPVRKGQRVMISIAAYHRLASVWGEDADIWRPERFLEGVASYEKTSVGVIANLVTFSSGVRNCIGWRFALLEMQTILVELIENFEFSPSPGNPQIIRAATSIMSPITIRPGRVKGSKAGRTELPLTITPVL